MNLCFLIFVTKCYYIFWNKNYLLIAIIQIKIESKNFYLSRCRNMCKNTKYGLVIGSILSQNIYNKRLCRIKKSVLYKHNKINFFCFVFKKHVAIWFIDARIGLNLPWLEKKFFVVALKAEGYWCALKLREEVANLPWWSIFFVKKTYWHSLPCLVVCGNDSLVVTDDWRSS